MYFYHSSPRWNRTAPEKCTHLYDDTRRATKNTTAFDTWSSSGVRREREKIIKGEGSKEEDRQEAEVKQCQGSNSKAPEFVTVLYVSSYR